MRTVRLRFIDATRGAAMLGVFLSHFGTAYLVTHGKVGPSHFAFGVGRVAAPTFLLVSGLLLGYRSFLRPLRYGDHADRLVDRALFLLTVAHALLVLAHAPLAGGFAQALRWEFMTDAIGLSLLCGVALVPRLSMPGRLALGFLLYVVSWAVQLVWQPSAFGARLALETLVGSTAGANLYTDSFPLLPWFGAYLVATVVGEWLARQAAHGGLSLPMRQIRNGGFLAIGLALSLNLGEKLSAFLTGDPTPWGQVARLMLAPSQKLPPGIAYLLFYGGVGAVLIWFMLSLEASRLGARVVRELAILGRSSLALFIAQYFVFFTVLPLLRLPDTTWWLVILLTAVAALTGFAKVWDGLHANRFLTIGYPRLAAWLTHRSAKQPAPAEGKTVSAPRARVVL